MESFLKTVFTMGLVVFVLIYFLLGLSPALTSGQLDDDDNIPDVIRQKIRDCTYCGNECHGTCGSWGYRSCCFHFHRKRNGYVSPKAGPLLHRLIAWPKINHQGKKFEWSHPLSSAEDFDYAGYYHVNQDSDDNLELDVDTFFDFSKCCPQQFD